MTRFMTLCAGGFLAAGLFAFGCETLAGSRTDPRQQDTDHSRLAAAEKNAVAVAEIHGAGDKKDKIHGKATFTDQPSGGVKVVVDVDGLEEGKHGIHIHEKTDLSDKALKGAGGHYNPGGKEHHHSGPDDPKRHAGDLGNIEVDSKGHG